MLVMLLWVYIHTGQAWKIRLAKVGIEPRSKGRRFDSRPWPGIFFKLARCGYTLRVTSQASLLLVHKLATSLLRKHLVDKFLRICRTGGKQSIVMYITIFNIFIYLRGTAEPNRSGATCNKRCRSSRLPILVGPNRKWCMRLVIQVIILFSYSWNIISYYHLTNQYYWPLLISTWLK
jgi:hypothetical protein